MFRARRTSPSFDERRRPACAKRQGCDSAGSRKRDRTVRCLRRWTGRLAPTLVPGDELIGNVIQVVADDLRLRADPQNIVADALDQRCFPAGRDGAERVPCMAGDQAELRGLNAKLPLDIGVSLARRLVMLHAVRAESPLEQIDNAAMFKLAGLNLKQIVRQREQPETRIAQLAQRGRNLADAAASSKTSP